MLYCFPWTVFETYLKQCFKVCLKLGPLPGIWYIHRVITSILTLLYTWPLQQGRPISDRFKSKIRRFKNLFTEPDKPSQDKVSPLANDLRSTQKKKVDVVSYLTYYYLHNEIYSKRLGYWMFGNCLDLLFYMCKGETISWLGETV